MEAKVIEWNSIEFYFVQDDTYENLNAPKWVDFAALDQLHIDDDGDDDSWFCNSSFGFSISLETNIFQVKFLRSITISEILPFKERTRRESKMKGEKANVLQTPKAAHSSVEENENKNPNLHIPKKAVTKTSSADKKQELDGNALKRKLRSTFSARNLTAEKEILNQITGFCSEIKFGKKRLKERANEARV